MTNELLRALLSGGRPAEPAASVHAPLIALAGREGVAPLVRLAAARAGWDGEFVEKLRPVWAAEVALSAVRAREVPRVLGSLHDAGVRPLLVKGAALEWTHYPAPGTRPRTDTDLLIAERDREAVRLALGALGYQPLAHVTGDVAFSQFHFWRVDDSGARHALDVHWRLVNPKSLADRLTYEELYSRRMAVPQLGPHAYAPAAGDALQIACLHRAAHHHNSMLLLWLYDIHLLAASLTAEEWRESVEAAIARGLGTFVRAGLEATVASFGTAVPGEIRDRLDQARAESPSELAAFDRQRPLVHLLVSDWQHVRGWRDRLRFLREHLFPSPTYIAHRYQTSNPAVLPFLYAHRIVTGARRYF